MSTSEERSLMQSVTMRDMTAADVAVVLRIERESYSVPWSEATFRGLLRRRDADVVVAVVDNVIVGYAALWCVLDQAELGNVAVTTAWRGRGMGAQLIVEAMRRAQARGVREVFLEVRPSNEPARKLYERHGFVQVGRRRNYYQSPIEDALVLRRTVANTPEQQGDAQI